MIDFDGERFMIKVRLLATRKNLFCDNQVAKCVVRQVRETPPIFS